MPDPVPQATTAEEVLLETSAGVLTITVNRPHVMNAVDGPMLERAAGAVETTDARVIVITGAGGSFGAGADLKRSEGNHTQLAGNRLVRAIVSAPQPVVAAVNGPAAGISMSVALAADLVIAHESAYFLQAFVNIGLMPDGGATELLAASVGRARANRLALLGERVPSAEAAAMGLIDRCCGDDFEDQVATTVARLAAGPPLAYAAIKTAVRATTLSRLDETLEREITLQSPLLDSADGHEGVAAFLEKRPAKFTGR